AIRSRPRPTGSGSMRSCVRSSAATSPAREGCSSLTKAAASWSWTPDTPVGVSARSRNTPPRFCFANPGGPPALLRTPVGVSARSRNTPPRFCFANPGGPPALLRPFGSPLGRREPGVDVLEVLGHYGRALARRRGFAGEEAPVDVGEQPRIVPGRATDHHGVDVLELLGDLVEAAHAAVDLDDQLGPLALEP